MDLPQHRRIASPLRDYGLVELPNAERHGSIWAILSADATIDVDKHLGDLGPQLAKLDYTTFGYHDHREFESEVSWKGALEEFAEGYHFPLVHGQSHHFRSAEKVCATVNMTT